ncbi:MAG: pyridoxal-phosphate dependent enzyme [Verrucomicrobiia bacterium]|jgi:threonine dehydratase
MKPPTINDIRLAAERIRPYAHRTPILTCSAIDELCDAKLYFKCENFQKVGAFKFRGATNAVFSLSDDEAARGVATHSSGNHAAALALAARMRGVPAHIVMPDNAPAVKKDAVAGYGANITFCQPTLQAREETLAGVIERTGAALVHPYDDDRVIAGQGTAALELCEDVPDLDVVMTPVGGGGLLAGTAIAVAAASPTTKTIAAEPVNADDACRSLQAGRIIPSENPKTIADGLLTSLGERNFPIIQAGVSAILTVSEDEIIDAMRLIWERMKIVVEPSGCVPLAAICVRRAEIPGRRIGVILSGGNVDLARLPWIRAA